MKLALALALALVSAPDRTEATLSSLRGAIAVFKIRNDRWPRTIDELARARLIDRAPVDAWGHSFLWLRPVEPNGSGCLLSMGPDGKPGTDDDLEQGCDRAALDQYLSLRAMAGGS
jgi:hypothetical protein